MTTKANGMNGFELIDFEENNLMYSRELLITKDIREGLDFMGKILQRVIKSYFRTLKSKQKSFQKFYQTNRLNLLYSKSTLDDVDKTIKCIKRTEQALSKWETKIQCDIVNITLLLDKYDCAKLTLNNNLSNNSQNPFGFFETNFVIAKRKMRRCNSLLRSEGSFRKIEKKLQVLIRALQSNIRLFNRRIIRVGKSDLNLHDPIRMISNLSDRITPLESAYEDVADMFTANPINMDVSSAEFTIPTIEIDNFLLNLDQINNDCNNTNNHAHGSTIYS
ncbi:uncharacterized protein LOC106658056 [Trichogramma pretiosum]|uniref:uncharacterized protein LOC106658056 n=1 Tax=Trichogramma pretiosum TaxID=7493 RepID=UPI0006C93F6C|nr:uncharacterized protein LOC106658056 [Trichogramma pretiosum]